ncbi:MAG: hypothetical protein AAF693_04070 [Bacteroidota bacterium]
MLRTISILLCSLLTTGGLMAQDVIVKKNGDEIEAVVLEVSTSEIKYKKYINREGPSYTINKSEVFMIRYENGTKDVFNDSNESKPVSGGATTKPGNTPSDLPRASFNINPLGLLQFGPIFQYEAKIGQRTYIVPHFRYAYAGLLTHAIWETFDDASELSAGTAALGVGIKGFAETSGNTWYYGGIADLEWGTAQYEIGESFESEEKATSLAILSNVGYRWRSSKGSYLNLGVFIGVASDLSSEETFINTGEVVDNSSTYFFGMVELSFGWEYK